MRFHNSVSGGSRSRVPRTALMVEFMPVRDILRMMTVRVSVSKIRPPSAAAPCRRCALKTALRAALALTVMAHASVTMATTALAMTVKLGADDGPNVWLLLHAGDRIHL